MTMVIPHSAKLLVHFKNQTMVAP